MSPAAPADNRKQEVSRWLARLESGLRGNEGVDLRDWLRDKANRAAILEAARVWHGPEIVSILSGLIPQAELVVAKPRRRSHFNLLFAGAAVLCIVLLGTGILQGVVQLPFDESKLPNIFNRGIYITAIGERRDVRLSDDSVVTLNTGSRLLVDYSQHVREVVLSRGEASFEVKPDPQRPFIVGAGTRRFEATGTRFNVRVITPHTVELMVTDGEVKVLDAPPRLPETPAQRRATLLYGETTVVALETAQVESGFQSVSKIDADQVKTRLAWHQGIIVFDDESLSDVLDEVDRYTTTQFVLADDQLRHIRIGGRFHTGDVDGLLAALRDRFRIDSRRDSQGRVVLTARTSL